MLKFRYGENLESVKIVWPKKYKWPNGFRLHSPLVLTISIGILLYGDHASHVDSCNVFDAVQCFTKESMLFELFLIDTFLACIQYAHNFIHFHVSFHFSVFQLS